MTLRLIAFAEENWPSIDGWSVTSGVDPMDLPIDRFLNLVYWFIVREGDPEDIEKFKIRLWRPPPGVEPTSGPWSPEAETQSFRAFSAQVKGAESVAATTS